jgi:hypothetical protein
MKNSMTTHEDGTCIPDRGAMSDGAFSIGGEQGTEARTPRVRARERLRFLEARRRYAWSVLLAFRLSRGQVDRYRTEGFQELRDQASDDIWITVLRHRHAGRRTTVSAKVVLEMVEALNALDEEIAGLRTSMRHALAS